MTKAQLMRFIKTRNKSSHASNLQFQIDAEDCGFKVADLGEVEKSGEYGYVWHTPYGNLYEYAGQLRLES